MAAKAKDLFLFQTVREFSVPYPASNSVKGGILSGHLNGIKLPKLTLYKHAELPSQCNPAY
jgi:hypothetical protein